MDPALAHTDEEIAAKVQQGESEVFGMLVDRYEPKLLRYGKKFLATKEDIEDIVQDVFLNTYRTIQSFDTAQRFSPWIYRIAHNAFVNALRKNEYLPISVDFDTFIAHPVYEDPVEREHDQLAMRLMIDRGLEGLSSKYREVLILYYFEELGYKDIADVLHVPIGTVSVRLRRAKELLKKNLKYEI